MDFTRSLAQAQEASNIDQGLRAFMISVFNHMAMALGITGAVAFITSLSTDLQQLLYGTPLMWVVAFAPLAMIFFMGSAMNYSIERARLMLALFSGLMGLSLGSIFLVYTNESIARVFFITASLFGSMSLYGYTTKKDLTSWGSFLMMGLIGILIAGMVNLFLGSTMIQFAVSVISVIVFVGLTAYDTQNLKQTYYQVAGQEAAEKVAVYGALTLYMDFINLFISMLRLFGNRRD